MTTIQMGLLEGGWRIRRELDELYWLISGIDVLREERGKTGSMQRRLVAERPVCAACGAKAADGANLEAHHILSLEEGGLTSNDNLVLLCRGCHEQYHEGLASQNEMKTAAEAGVMNTPCDLGQLMQARKALAMAQQGTLRPLVDTEGILTRAGTYQLISRRRWRRALRGLSFEQTKVSEEDEVVLTVVKAQIERRRGAEGSLARAYRLLTRLKTIPDRRKPVFFYELGYVRQLMGHSSEAATLFGRSARTASMLQDRYGPLEQLIGEVQGLAARVIARKADVLTSSLPQISARLDEAGERAACHGGSFGGRWRLNCLHWICNLLIKCRRYDDAQMALQQVRTMRSRQNVTDGWTLLAGAEIAAAEGLLLVLSPQSGEPEIQRGLELLARSVVRLIGVPCQRPEGIRDKLLGVGAGLQRIGRVRDAAGIEAVRGRIIDGSSFLDPYRANDWASAQRSRDL